MRHLLTQLNSTKSRVGLLWAANQPVVSSASMSVVRPLPGPHSPVWATLAVVSETLAWGPFSGLRNPLRLLRCGTGQLLRLCLFFLLLLLFSLSIFGYYLESQDHF